MIFFESNSHNFHRLSNNNWSYIQLFKLTFCFKPQYSKLQILNATAALSWINDWDNSLDEQMDRAWEEIMTTSSGTGNGKRICDEK